MKPRRIEAPRRAGGGWLVGLAVMIATSACGMRDKEEIKLQMAAMRKDMQPTVTAIPEPRHFEPSVYTMQGSVDPFSPEKVDIAMQRLAAKSSGGYHPDLDRPRQELENFPVDAIRMVGALQQGKERIAILRVDKQIYQAKVGQFIGQNFGKIIKISETELVLKESVRDAANDWVERNTTLQLQENSK